mmetsp:Transcript_11702/g.28761  ORF Transcript_11702/g.28761 Transcript_11702/m.28761 type:complete len:698 (-) Transcript_11702:140-2233(-)|eukprot:CAMPEP_0181118152 /NCGR_PEP_ID=MMETSP1071-20121207/22916_1 /TAXON_ID=35127 /ORGANISM="Thalassiosira sp., Strain NH16" /LENGTH=697 /DNA_ID=CAMNT_0023202613 /DNA_START=70 /DNA_END=2163 /DNA_ORIENTATION=+
MDEKSSLLPSVKKDDDHGATRRRASLGSFSRFGDVETAGVRPSGDSIANIPQVMLEGWHQRSLSAQVDSASELYPRQRQTIATSSLGNINGESGGLGGHQRARSFIQAADGSYSALTPLEMGRHELYEELPFLAVPGLQKKEHNLSVAFSSYAAALDTLETEEYYKSTTGKGMNPEEKEQRLSRMSLLLLDELEADAITVTTPLIFAVLIASMLMFNAGYNISVMNAPEPFVFPGHSTGAWSVAVAAFCVGGPIGSVLAGKWADERGRKGALLLTTWLFIIGGLIQSLAPSLVVVMIARAVIGVASGASTVLVPIYLGELAPPNLRGVIGTMTQFALVVGILFADIVGFVLANETQWRWMFFLVSVMAILQLFLTPLLLESPRWLLGKNANSSKARFIIKKLRGYRYDEEVETEASHYLGAVKTQSLDDDDSSGKEKEKKNAMAEMFADKKVRLLVVSTLVLQVANQFSGINAVFYYSGIFFDGVIENPLVGTTIIGAVNVLATYLALLLMDRCGRRTLIMWSTVGMFLSCVMIVLSLLDYFNQTVALGAVASYVSFFEIGLGPIPWLIVAEMFDGKYISSAMSVSSQLNWTCNFFVGLLFPYLNESLGPYSFAPFAIVLLLTFIYAWIWLPETAGTTPAELQAELVKKNALVTYHNMDIQGMAGSVPATQDEWAQAMADIASEEENLTMVSWNEMK